MRRPLLIVVLLGAAACDSPPAPSIPAPTPVVTGPGSPAGALQSRWVPAPAGAPASSSDPVVGRYRLDVAVESGCSAVPQDAKARTYTADINTYNGPGADYVVRLYDATFVYGLTCLDYRYPQEGTPICNQLLASRSADTLNIHFLPIENDDNWRGSRILEQLPIGTWIEMQGNVSGRLDNGNLAATGTASLEYWLSVNPSRYEACTTDGFRLTFARR